MYFLSSLFIIINTAYLSMWTAKATNDPNTPNATLKNAESENHSKDSYFCIIIDPSIAFLNKNHGDVQPD